MSIPILIGAKSQLLTAKSCLGVPPPPSPPPFFYRHRRHKPKFENCTKNDSEFEEFEEFSEVFQL
jgi:hypothetical protein